MANLHPSVRAGWCAFNAPLEGRVRTLYRDIRGLVTAAIGILCNSPGAAQAMRWQHPGGAPASSAEVAAEWARVAALPPGRVWSYYCQGPHLELSDDELDRVTLARLDDDVEILARTFPDCAAWPAPAQAATCSMAWAMGAGFPASWPHWSASARAQDWRGCADNCEIRWQDNPGLRPRDMAQRALFLMAAGVDAAEVRAGWPAGFSAERAGEALDGLALGAEPAPETPRNAGD